ncbi:hypothetical protein E2C01_052731 [Portunus trituberculatus]|uniref:Uncharacterized protein n=1 Tax=Portunus trituberculatus TaxID=210409 RepID=A0A5B7GIG1_PORTR|nr:hypothetical protein [Portunus trituberculatus]
MHNLKTYWPVDDVSEGIELSVADMVNHLFDHGMREKDYKPILDDEITKRPINCHALTPAECNAQILALKVEVKKAVFRMKKSARTFLKLPQSSLRRSRGSR